jgi:outer membrane protein assembly factor BamD (BamD/ComL family)
MRGLLRTALILSLMLVALTACSSGPMELYETARFEEKQGNYEHAAELYEEIIKKYPASEFTPQAKERLDKIKGAAQ